MTPNVCRSSAELRPNSHMLPSRTEPNIRPNSSAELRRLTNFGPSLVCMHLWSYTKSLLTWQLTSHLWKFHKRYNFRAVELEDKDKLITFWALQVKGQGETTWSNKQFVRFCSPVSRMHGHEYIIFYWNLSDLLSLHHTDDIFRIMGSEVRVTDNMDGRRHTDQQFAAEDYQVL